MFFNSSLLEIIGLQGFITSIFSALFTAFYGRQWSRWLEDSHDIWAHLLHLPGNPGVRHTPHPRELHLHLDGPFGILLRPIKDRCGCGHHPVHPNVSEAVSHRSGHAAPQQALYWCLFPEHRCPQQDQLQYSLCDEDPHDHLSWHCFAGLHHLALDHRCMDSESLREVPGSVFQPWTVLHSPKHR